MKKFRRTKTDVPVESVPVVAKKQKRIWAIAIILVMAMSVVGFLTFDYSGMEKYNGFKIVQVNDRTWKVVTIPDLLFYSPPKQLASFPLTEEFMLHLKAAPVLFFTSPPGDINNDTINAVVFDLVWPFAQRDAVIRHGSTAANTSFPFVACGNATASVPVVVLQTGINRSLDRAGACFTFTGQSTRDFVEFRDRILYGLYDVIPDASLVHAGDSP